MRGCSTCQGLIRLRERYQDEAALLERVEREKARTGDRGRGRPPVVKPTMFDLVAALDWFFAHRRLPVEEGGEHPALDLMGGAPAELLTEAQECSEARFRQRVRRFSIRLLATLAECSESTARASVKEVRDPLPAPDLEWADADEWIVGRDPTGEELKAAKRSRLDPGPLDV